MNLRRHVGRVAAAVVAAAAIAVAAGWWLGSRHSSSPGPLVAMLSGQSGVGIVLNVGQSASVSGPLLIRNTGDTPVVLDRVEPVDMRSGFDFVGAYVVPHPNHIGEVPGYKVPANGHVLPGAIVAPHQEVELVLGVRAAKHGRYGFKTFDIVYHGGGSYRRHAALGIAVCAPAAKYPSCPSPVGPRRGAVFEMGPPGFEPGTNGL